MSELEDWESAHCFRYIWSDMTRGLEQDICYYIIIAVSNQTQVYKY